MVKNKVIGLVASQFNLDGGDIDLDTSFKDDLNADSLDLVELVMALEDEFNLEVEDEDVDSIKTVGDAIDYIINLLGDE